MGGVGSGGRRVGAGAKPKSKAERALAGRASHSSKVVAHPSAPAQPAPPPPVEFDEADAPNDLDFEQRQVWLRLAPRAKAAGTLTDETGDYFKVLCRMVVLEERYGKSVLEAGTANHRGLVQRVAAMMKDFALAPFGKPVTGQQQAPAVDPMKAKYFGGGRG